MFMQDATRFAPDAAWPVIAPAPLAGMGAGTLVETAKGWRAAETLRIGTEVHTAEGGLRPILALDRQTLTPGAAMIRLPGGSFDNCTAMDLMPDQDLVLDHPDGLRIRIAARMLVGQRGVAMIKAEHACERVTPLFAEDEVIWSNSGTRLYCVGIGGRRHGGFIPRSHGADLLDLLAELAQDRAA